MNSLEIVKIRRFRYVTGYMKQQINRKKYDKSPKCEIADDSLKSFRNSGPIRKVVFFENLNQSLYFKSRISLAWYYNKWQYIRNIFIEFSPTENPKILSGYIHPMSSFIQATFQNMSLNWVVFDFQKQKCRILHWMQNITLSISKSA